MQSRGNYYIYIVVLLILVIYLLINYNKEDTPGQGLKEFYNLSFTDYGPSNCRKIRHDFRHTDNFDRLAHFNDLSRIEQIQFNFSSCRMHNCFDLTRCRPDEPLKIHIVQNDPQQLLGDLNSTSESKLIHMNILRIIRKSQHFEPDPNKACLFVLEYDTLDRDPLGQGYLHNLGHLFDASNNFGMNYLLFNLYSGTWPDYRVNDYSGIDIGAAILAKASNSDIYHRPNFDISLPLFSYKHPFDDAEPSDAPRESLKMGDNQTYFLTFKGKRYVFGSGSDTRNSLYHIDNKRDVIMLTTCRHGKKWREYSDRRCTEDENSYGDHDFEDLMRDSVFCLIPRGRRLGSFRYLEAMSFGCIPVILSDGWVKPFDEIIDWSCASVQYAEEDLLLVPDMLRDIELTVINQMKRNCKNLYNEYFATMEKIILTTISIIEERIRHELKLQTRR